MPEQPELDLAICSTCGGRSTLPIIDASTGKPVPCPDCTTGWVAGASHQAGSDHLCRNHRCVNPAHLEPVTHGENILRGNSPSAKGARQTHCKHGHPLSGDNLRIKPEGVSTVSRLRTSERQGTKQMMLRAGATYPQVASSSSPTCRIEPCNSPTPRMRPPR